MKSYLLAGLCIVLVSPGERTQDAVSAIDRSRLLQQALPAPVSTVDSNGNALGQTTEVEDDTFGAQMLLKEQERVRPFSLSAGSSFYYTSNVALPRRDTRDDVFAVVQAAGTWTQRSHPEVEMQIDLQASIFRDNRESQLDFNDLGSGRGRSWTPRRWSGSGRSCSTPALSKTFGSTA